MALLDKTQLNYIGGVSQLTDVNKIQNQAIEQTNSIVSIKSGGIRKRNSLEMFSSLNNKTISDDAMIYEIDRTDNEKYIIIIQNKPDGSAEILAYDKNGDPFPVIMDDLNSSIYLGSSNPKTSLRHVIVNDTTYLLNREITTSMTKIGDNNDPLLTPPDYNQAMVWVKNVDYAKTFEIIIDGKVEATHTTPDPETPEEVENVNSDYVAEQLLKQLELHTENYQFDIVNGSVILISNNDLDAKWTLETKDGMGGAGMSEIKDTIKTDAELPSQSFNGFKIKVDGDPLTSEGDYYYKFEVEGSQVKGDGSWVETLAEKIEYEIAEYSMPQKLVSYEDRFELVPVDWFDRLVGDDDTNPFPTFLNKRINDIFLFSNRIGFLSGDSIVLSEYDVYTNFFKSSIRATLETDYIDVTASTTELNILRHAVVFNNQLVVNSDKNFFSLGFQGNNISNANASLQNFGSYETSPNIRPQQKGTSMYYVNDVNENARMYELYVNNYNSSDIREVSFMVPEYMPKELDTFYVKPDNNIFMLNKSGDNDIYIYQEVKQNGQMVVSAFHKWTLAEGVSIVGIVDIDEGVAILANYKGFSRLYTLNLSETHNDKSFGYHNHLDYKQTNEDVINVAFDENKRKTRVILANNLDADKLTVVIREDFGDVIRGEALYCSEGEEGVYYFDKDISGAEFMIGERYDQTYTHGTFYSQNRDGTNRTQGNTQITSHELYFENTGYFEVGVTYMNRNNRTQIIKHGMLGFGEHGSDKLDSQNLFTGSKKYGITNVNDKTRIKISNKSHLPLNIIRCNYIYRYWGRTQGS